MILVQLFFTTVMGLYFFNMLKSQQTSRSGLEKDSAHELEKLHRLKQIRLTEPLAEKTRPSELSDIIGQEERNPCAQGGAVRPKSTAYFDLWPPGSW